MIYKITNIRLRNGRTLNRGFIIESDKMLSRNKIATLIKERTNFTPVDFSAKMHRNLFESQKDVDDAIAAGEEIKRKNREHNKSAKEHNDNLKVGYRTAYNQKRSDAEAAAREKDKNSELRKSANQNDESKTTQSNLLDEKNYELSEKEGQVKEKNDKLSEIDTEIQTLSGEKTEIDTKIQTLSNKKTEIDTKIQTLSNKKTEIDAEIKNLNNEIVDSKNLISAIQQSITKYETQARQDREAADEELNKALANIATQYPELQDDLITTIKEYKKDFDKNKKNEIDETDGVNLATVKNYFEKKREDLTNIIAEFDKKVKRTKEGDKVKTVYTRLENVLKEFSKEFDEIKKRIIKQYEKSNKNKASSASITPTKGSGRPSNNRQINIRRNSLNNPRMKGSGRSSNNPRINIRGNLRKR